MMCELCSREERTQGKLCKPCNEAIVRVWRITERIGGTIEFSVQAPPYNVYMTYKEACEAFDADAKKRRS